MISTNSAVKHISGKATINATCGVKRRSREEQQSCDKFIDIANYIQFCAEYGVNYDKFMNWQRHQLWNEKLGKTIEA